MKKLVLFLAIFAFVIFACSCNLIRHDVKAYFWAIDHHENPLVLFIDGKNSGSLPQIPEEKDDEDSSITNNALLVNLPTGEYELELKIVNGKVLHTGTLEMEKSAGSDRVEVSWTINADCKVKVFFY